VKDHYFERTWKISRLVTNTFSGVTILLLFSIIFIPMAIKGYFYLDCCYYFLIWLLILLVPGGFEIYAFGKIMLTEPTDIWEKVYQNKKPPQL
jgi:hypothetical protein